MATPDEALKLWAAEEVNRGPEEIASVDFGYSIDCWSDITHEYGVYAVIRLTDGSEVKTTNTWSEALEGIGEYRDAEMAMDLDHDTCHDYDYDDDWEDE